MNAIHGFVLWATGLALLALTCGNRGVTVALVASGMVSVLRGVWKMT
jgi:hypothetical protein